MSDTPHASASGSRSSKLPRSRSARHPETGGASGDAVTKTGSAAHGAAAEGPSGLAELPGGIRVWREEVDTYLGDGAAGELTANASMRWAESTVHAAMEGGKVPAGAPGVAAALGIYEEWRYASARIVEHDWEEGWLLVESSGTAESRMHLREGGPSEYPVCDMLRGLIAGSYLYLRKRAGLPADGIRAVEVSCAAQGHPQCRFAVGSTETLAAHGVEAPPSGLTSRREIEETLQRCRESESSLQKFVEGMPFGVVELDTDGRITFANHKTLELLGVSPGRIRGTHFSVHVHPEDQEVVQGEFQKVVEGRADPYPVQCRLVRADGTSRPCAVDAFPVYDVRDRIAGYQGIIVDLADRVHLGASAQRFHEGLRELPRPFLELEPEGRVRYANGPALELLGARAEEVLGEPFDRFVAGESSSEAYRTFLEVAAGRVGSAVGRWELARPDGGSRAAELHFVADGLKIGKVERVLVLADDVAARDEAAGESEKRLHYMVSSGPAVIYTSEPGGDYAATFISDNVVAKTGYEPRQFTEDPKFWASRIHPEDAPRVLGDLSRLSESGHQTHEYRFLHKDGSYRWTQDDLRLVRDAQGDAVEIIGSWTDITERRRAEEALRESEEKWRSLAENAPSIIIIASRDGTIQYINRTVSGLTVEGTLGKTLYEFIEPEYHDVVREASERVFDTGEPTSYEIRGVGPDGRTSWYSTQLGPITRNGEVVATTLITTDITDRKQSEEALRESEARFRAVFDNATDGIVLADTEEKRFQVANKKFCEMLGCALEDVTSLGVADVHREEDLPHVMQQFEKQLRGEITLARDIPVMRMDGTVFYADINASPVILAGRAYLMGIFRDVTERRRTDEALRESEELHRTLMNALPDAVTMSDLEGRITYASQRTLEVHGYDNAGELVGESAFELIAPEDREMAAANLQKTLEGGSAKDLEYTLLRKDGSRFPAELSAAVVPDARGEPKAFVAITHDITERRRKERELRAVEGRREELSLEVAALRSEMQGRYGPESIIGRDSKMHAIYETILAVGRTNATVLIQGETGTGKELVAKAVHYNSSRREKPFVKVDCGALAENLLESELFGHVKGAFTGAVRDRAGRFELAADATIFLDEIHNLSMPLQAKLLRVVQEGRFEKVGGTKTIEVDVRIVAATNEDLESLVAQGGFRKDLYYRVNVIPIKLPPLRDRRGDIPLLVSAFIHRFAERHDKQAAGVSREALERLTGYDWPGNVRELENIVEQAVVFSAGRTIQADDVRLPEASLSREGGPSLDGRPPSLRKALEDPEKQALLDALGRTGGNKKKAAELLGISRSALYEKLKRHGISTKR